MADEIRNQANLRDGNSLTSSYIPPAQASQVNSNDVLREALVQVVIMLAPIIIKNFLTDEMIKQLLARLTSGSLARR